MNYNYHTHTFRCRHASGTPEEYIQRAIQGGIKYMGFSDHFPFAFPDGRESGYRVPIAEVKDYFSELNVLREKYRDQIDIKIGFEMEYYPTYFDDMLNNAVAYGAEYLILGQHFIGEEYPNGMPSGRGTKEIAHLQEYVSCVVSAIQSGAFTYVAHPDIFVFQGEQAVYDREMRKICQASKEYNVPLEINFLGIRETRFYPHEEFWKIAGEVGAPVTFGCDAHTVQSACDPESVEKAKQLVQKYHLNYIGMPNLRFIQVLYPSVIDYISQEE